MGYGVPAILCWKSQHLGWDRCHLPIFRSSSSFSQTWGLSRGPLNQMLMKKKKKLTPSFSHSLSRRGYWLLRNKSFWSEKVEVWSCLLLKWGKTRKNRLSFIHEYEQDAPPQALQELLWDPPGREGLVLISMQIWRCYAFWARILCSRCCVLLRVKHLEVYNVHLFFTGDLSLSA